MQDGRLTQRNVLNEEKKQFGFTQATPRKLHNQGAIILNGLPDGIASTYADHGFAHKLNENISEFAWKIRNMIENSKQTITLSNK